MIGAGIAGAATARALARAGHEVVVLERFPLGHRRGSSHGSSRIFRLNYPDERYVRLAQASLQGWRELEAESGVQLLTHNGALDLGDRASENAQALSACGITFELLTGAEVADRWSLAVEAAEHAVFQPDGGVLAADRAYEALVESARSHGAEFREEVPALELELASRSVRVRTATDELRADAVVVTAGAWAPALLAPLGIDLAVTPTRETVVYLELDDAAMPSLIDYERVPVDAAGLARPGQVGYALHAPGIGLKAGLHHAGAVTDPDDDPDPDRELAEWIVDWAHGRFPAAGRELAAETCIYTNTADEGFVVERHGRVVVGSACSGHGFKFAPEVGRILAALTVEATRLR
ncbi:MAG: FAD-dependent oxidoreductase [Gaiella sp.]